MTILLNGEISPTQKLKDDVAGSTVIAADGGIRHAMTLEQTPDYWVGDFDSVDQQLKDRFQSIARDAYPSEKAVSDGEIALTKALSLSPSEIIVVGATGGERADHFLINLTVFLRFAAENRDIEFSVRDGRAIIYPLLPGRPLALSAKKGSVFSVVAFSQLKGLSIAGAKWPLEDVNVDFGSTLTLSNEIVDQAKLSLVDGHAIAIVQVDA